MRKVLRSLVGISLAFLPHLAQAQTPITPPKVTCAVAIVAPASSATISGTPTVTISKSCNGASGFNRLYVSGPNGYHRHYDFFGDTFRWDTSPGPDGDYLLDVIVWDITGQVPEGGTLGSSYTATVSSIN